MTKPILDMTGHVYGDLTVIELAGRKTHRTLWKCRCVCGGETIVNREWLRNGKSRDCGCHAQADRERRHIPHGHTTNGRWTPEYSAWKNMIFRCENPNYKHYRDYGGRGITICMRWNNFQNFFADMGEKPSREYSLDRIDVNGNYEPSNCRWATQQQQVLNRRPILRAKRQSLDFAIEVLMKMAEWEFSRNATLASEQTALRKFARESIDEIHAIDRGERRIGIQPRQRFTGRDAPPMIRIGSVYATYNEIMGWMESGREAAK